MCLSFAEIPEEEDSVIVTRILTALAIVLPGLTGCSEYDSGLDCLRNEMRGATTANQQQIAVAYCKEEYGFTEEEVKKIRGY